MASKSKKRWHAFIPTHKDRREDVVVAEVTDIGQPYLRDTRREALECLEPEVEKQMRSAMAEATRLGRVLATIREMKEHES